MSNKVYSAKEAALAVLKKTEEILKKSEVLAKYETENSKRLDAKEPKEKAKLAEKSDSSFEVEKQGSKSKDERFEKTTAPSNNPKEKAGAPGNNRPYGAVPEATFKSEGYPKELASKNIEHNMKEKSKFPGGEKQAVAAGINEAREGEDVSKKSDDSSRSEGYMPIKHHVSAKLAKFMEWKHAKGKNKSAEMDKGLDGNIGSQIASGFNGATAQGSAPSAPVKKSEKK